MRWLFLFIMFFSSGASSAEFEVYSISDDRSVPTIVHMRGYIESGDAEKFEKVIEGKHKVTLLLESHGGLVAEALGIGATVRLRDFATMVAKGGECFSACGLIWVASSRRYMLESSQIGFHAAYRQVGDYLEESGEANAAIGSFLTHLGLRLEAIRFFTQSGPHDLALLTPFLARALGIDIYLQIGSDVVPPWENPTVDRMAVEKASLMAVGSICESLFGKAGKHLLTRAEELDVQGTKIVGDFWHELWLREVERYRSIGPNYTIAHACVEAENVARDFGHHLFDGPSFDCGRATTGVEIEICRNADLSAKDRIISGLYFFILEGVNSNVLLPEFREFHQGWLQRRDRCGANSRCILGAYDELIDVYGAIHLDTPER